MTEETKENPEQEEEPKHNMQEFEGLNVPGLAPRDVAILHQNDMCLAQKRRKRLTGDNAQCGWLKCKTCLFHKRNFRKFVVYAKFHNQLGSNPNPKPRRSKHRRKRR